MLIKIMIVFIIFFVIILITEEIRIRDILEDNNIIYKTLNDQIKAYEDLTDENLHLYQQLKEYQDKELEKEI